jgi:y4mF family transcriptional regulator
MAVNLDPSQLSQLIKATRKRAGLSQLELAEMADVGKTLIFDLEKGHMSFQFDKLLRILRVLNIKLLIEEPQRNGS